MSEYVYFTVPDGQTPVPGDVVPMSSEDVTTLLGTTGSHTLYGCVIEDDTVFGQQSRAYAEVPDECDLVFSGVAPITCSNFDPLLQKYKHTIPMMRLFDDDFMRAVFHENKEATQEVLRIIMDKSDLVVLTSMGQTELKNLFGRSTRLDVLAQDSSGKYYNIEVQRSEKGAGIKRARYNQSILDTNLLPSGEDPEKLPETHVIFIAETDVFRLGLPIYHIDRVLRESGKRVVDGENIIYLNGEYPDDSTALGALIADFHETDPDRIRNRVLAERVRFLKKTERGVRKMCKIMEDIVKEEVKENTKKIILGAYRKGHTAEAIADFNDIPLDEVLEAIKGEK